VTPLRRRRWFQDAYIRCASMVMAGVMAGRTPSDTVAVIEAQLERAYRRGVADAKAGRA
jgi:hypothetical protein